MTNVVDIIQSITRLLKGDGFNVFCAKQWFDFRTQSEPVLSVFVLEESLLDFKGSSFKQELIGRIEGHVQQSKSEDIYCLASYIKHTLLTAHFPFQFYYLGYDISLPEEGSNMISLQVRFKVTYVEEIHKEAKHARL